MEVAPGPTNFPVPDVRFEETFNRAINKEAEKQREYSLKKKGLTTDEISKIKENEAPEVTTYIVWKVIVRDMLIMPFIQGIMFSGLLIILKPWLRSVVGNGRRFGTFIYNTVLGKNLTKTKKQ
ncbi:hypothetical protein Kpol_1063p10 [Vanderwaltozyma polyspora DSM 70294]|uniref:Uncharacterized protein n=1 Tax=Vanderwaltozyma polyspora (strain ATCC 22028 / DSM 70294 / BCRC 21397 / CBS 2163 / NBRC 10782 / NRRL Y-8283 / UCD 57-17) TaxID=436907 RepID=A7TQQ5_VANPO|nr:uncharacterized protein Kpol_1063p10 [Vanderwaltozyma polyspora DSM 70294]EDO15400.1 hypothetical protein Kpol_1063p10 [Vanderwaltozyma polyspora DSM 70294]